MQEEKSTTNLAVIGQKIDHCMYVLFKKQVCQKIAYFKYQK